MLRAPTVVLLAGLLVAPAALVAAVGDRPIRPGATLAEPGSSVLGANRGTLNAVWMDDAGRLFIGAAGHSFAGVGARASTPGVGEFGTVVYRVYVDEPASMDYSLVLVDEDKEAFVDPALQLWGGPTGIDRSFVPGTPLLQYGHGVPFDHAEATRARVGVLRGENPDGGILVPQAKHWFSAVMPEYGGDSGSLLIGPTGEAVGIVAALALDDAGPVTGPTFALIGSWLQDAGFDLALVTAPVQPQLAETLARCAATPVGPAPDGCVSPD